MKSKILITLLILGASILIGGCLPNSKPRSANIESINETKTGRLNKGVIEGQYLLIGGPGQTTELHDGSVTLEPYVGQSIEVTGQFSGTTLYVDQIQVLP